MEKNNGFFAFGKRSNKNRVVNLKQPKIFQEPRRWPLAIFFVLFLVVIALYLILRPTQDIKIADNDNISPAPTASSTCPTWVILPAPPDNKDMKLFVDGSPEIMNATTTADAKNAVLKWLDDSKYYVPHYSEARNAIFPAKLYGTSTVAISPVGSCASSEMQAEYKRMYDRIALLKDGEIMPGLVETTWQTTTLEGGQIKKSGPGIYNNRKSILVYLPDGVKFAVQGWCGNIATPPDKPVTPTEKTPKKDDPPKKVIRKTPEKDVGVNPAVDTFKKDDTGGDANKGHHVTNGNGAVIPNGVQSEPKADAVVAEKKAQTEIKNDAAESVTAQKEAKATGGGVVDTNQAHTEATQPGSDW